MPYTDTAKARMLNHLAGNAATSSAATHIGAHTAGVPTTGNEVTGGSPAYARKSLTFEAVAGTELAGSLDVSNSPVIDVPAGTTVRWLGIWTASTAGTLLAYMPNGGGAYKPFSVDDAATDVLDAAAHGFSNGDTVVVWGASLPTGLSQHTVYHVRDVTTNSLKLAATAGGAAIDITAIGHGDLQRIVEETFGAQGTLTVTDVDLAISG